MWAHYFKSNNLSPKIISRHAGFTIVELLIVIVVIAILAAITIVAFNGVQERAQSSSASQYASQAARKVKTWQVDKEGQSPTCTEFYELINNTQAGAPTSMCTFDYKGTNYQYTPLADGNYCITSTVATKSFKTTLSGSLDNGGCDGHGQGGVAAITNVSINPSAESAINNSYIGPNGATTTQSTARAKDGTRSVLVTLPTANSSTAGVSVTNGYTIPANFKPNTEYTFSVWVYIPSATVDVRLSAQGPGTSSTNCGSVNTGTTSTKNAWVRLSCRLTTSASGGISLYALNSSASTAGMQFHADSVMITEGTTLYNYADGTSTNWAWNGGVHTSTSSGPPTQS